MSNELLERERAIQLRLAGEAVEAICQRLKHDVLAVVTAEN